MKSKLESWKDYSDLPASFPPLPAKYKDVPLMDDWFMHGKKRKKEKTVGKLSFVQLTAMISEKWNNVEPDIKKYVTTVATIVKDRRNNLVRSYLLLLRHVIPP